MVNRTLGALLAMSLLPSAASAQAAWTEHDVVRMARSRSADVAAAEAEVAVARSEEIGASLRPNPSLGWEREQVFSPDASQDVVRWTQPIDVSSRVRARTAIARVRTALARAEVAAARADVIARALEAFDDAIAAELRRALAASELSALTEAARVVRSREAGGVGAGFDVVRLEIEVELVRSRVAEAQASRRAAEATLASIVGLDAARMPRLVGNLESRDPEALGVLLARARRRRQELRAGRSAQSVARGAARSTSGSWWPLVTVSAGLDMARDARESALGYAGSVTIEVPISSRGQDVDAQARAAATLASARLAAIEAHVEREVAVARAQLASARAELARFDGETRPRMEALRVAAESGYREGARTIVELLDARRASFEIETRKLELAIAARRADVALRRATGELR
ncbi:MAG: TolC family protein [Deltaproteobacteria bacterium]|nr:TolC family protein [Deltaproteobacteria bacterium]